MRGGGGAARGTNPRSLIFQADSVDHCTAGALRQWLKLPACKVRDRGLEPCSGIQVKKKKKKFLAQFSIYVHKGGLKPHSFIHSLFAHLFIHSFIH